jgi:hypothetical protein
MALGQVNKKYISSLDFLDQREILGKILNITNEEMSFLDIMELSGRSVATKMPTYHHHVNEELYTLGSVTLVATSAAAGASATHTRDITLSAATAANVKAGQLIYFKDNKVGYVKAKTGNILTVEMVDRRTPEGQFATGTITVGAGDSIPFFSNAAGEGSGSPDSIRYGTQKYANQVQIFKDKFAISAIQRASAVEVEFEGKPYIMYKGQHDALMKFRADISFGLFMSRQSAANFESATPTFTDAEGNPVQTTKGIDQYMEDGITRPLGGVPLSLVDIRALTKELNLRRAPDDYLVFLGTNKNIEWDDMFNQLGNSTTLSTAAQFMIGKNLELGIDSVKIYGRTYHKKYLPLLDHKNVTNFNTSFKTFSDAAYFVPNDKVKTQGSGETIDRLRVRYLSGDGVDLRYNETMTGKFAPTPTNDRSVTEIHYESVQGVEILGANHFAKVI